MKYSLSNDTWGSEEFNAAKGVLESRFYSMGESVRQFEKDFAHKFGAKYAVMSNSGSSANLIAIASLLYSGRLNRGDEVLVTAVSWSTTYYPISQMGLKIRFIDIDRDTLNVDINKLENGITKDTKAIMVVNLLGNPNDFDSICDICKKHDLLMLEDNCESMGAKYDEKYTGSFGLVGSFSTYYSHHICTMEGGMTLTDDEELYHYMLSIRSHGWTRHIPNDSTIYKKASDPFYESFNFIMPGFNLRPLEIEAAIGVEQLKKLDGFVMQRKENAKKLIEKINEKTDLLTQCEIGESSWFGFAIVLPKKMEGKRDFFTNALRRAGIEVRPIVSGNFTRQKAIEYLEYSISGNLENADYIHENGFFVGNHSKKMDDEIEYLLNELIAVENKMV